MNYQEQTEWAERLGLIFGPDPQAVGREDGTEDDYGDLLHEVALALGIEDGDPTIEGEHGRLDDLARDIDATSWYPWLGGVHDAWFIGPHKPTCAIVEQRATLQKDITAVLLGALTLPSAGLDKAEANLDYLRGAEREYYGGGDQEAEGCDCGLYDDHLTVKLPWDLVVARIAGDDLRHSLAHRTSGRAAIGEISRRYADDNISDEGLALIIRGAAAVLAVRPETPVGVALDTAMVWHFG